MRYVLVCLLEESPVEFTATEWPLHMTLLGNFTTTKSSKNVTDTFRECASALTPIQITLDSKASFGVNSDIPVMTVRITNDIQNLHFKLLKSAEDLSILYDTPQYVGEGYRPHVTIKKSINLQPGQILQIDNITLVDLQPRGDITRRRIVEQFNLG